MAVFAAVAREGSFTRGANALGVTKQTASERVAKLEAHLGVQLLVRSTRQLRLTVIGEEYARTCVGLVAQAENANLVARQSQLHPTGVLRVTCPVGLARPLVMPALEEYRRMHPSVSFEVLIEERVVDLVAEHIDLAVRVGTDTSSPLYVTRPLFEADAVFVASREFLARHGEPRTVAEARALPHVVRGIARPRNSETLDAAVCVNTVVGVADAVRAGLGIGVVPSLIVADELASGKLRVLFGHPARRMRFVAVWPARRLPTKTRVLLDILLKRARGLGSV